MFKPFVEEPLRSCGVFAADFTDCQRGTAEIGKDVDDDITGGFSDVSYCKLGGVNELSLATIMLL